MGSRIPTAGLYPDVGGCGMRWFQALLPRDENFFDHFSAHARLLLQGAEALRGLLNGGDGMAAASADVNRHEEAADEITRTVFLAIRRTFITPFDRSDITDLVTSIANAELALNTIVTIRDKVISAYQDIIRMPM